MFLELKELTINVKTKVADYSFIFHKMKRKPLYAINTMTTQPGFILFLNKTYDANIKGKKLPYKDPHSKEATYAAILEKYEKVIINNEHT